MKRLVILSVILAFLLVGCVDDSFRSDGEDHSAARGTSQQTPSETTATSDSNYITVWANGKPMTVDLRQWDILHPDRVATYSLDLRVDPSWVVPKGNPNAMQVVVNDVTYYIDPSRVIKKG